MAELQRKGRKSKRQIKAEDSKKVLCILEEENPVTAIERDAIIECIGDNHIAMLAKGQPEEIQGKCINGYFIGQGTCVAKKFGKYGLTEDPNCKSCKHDEILDQLNYIFREAFGNKYRAEWKQKRVYKKQEVRSVDLNKVELEVEELSKKEECMRTLASMSSDKAETKSRRRNKETKSRERNKIEDKDNVSTNRTNTDEISEGKDAAVKVKRRGRPRKEKTK